MDFVHRLTGIPNFKQQAYGDVEKTGDYAAVQAVLRQFCTASSEQLQQMHYPKEMHVSVVEQFDQSESFTMLAKGTSLERTILGRFLQMKPKLGEFTTFIKQKYRVEDTSPYYKPSHTTSR